MKAKKIDLSQYATVLKDENGEPQMFDVRSSLVNVLFHPNLKLGAVEILERDELRKDIQNEETDTLLVTPEDWEKLRAGVECIEGFGQNDVGFIRRVLEAPEVTVEEPAETPAE